MADDIKDSGSPSKKTPRPIDVFEQFSSFFANEHHAFLAKKSERLASALHVVTGFIASEEPLRNRLRAASLEVMQFSTDLERLGKTGHEAFGTKCAEIASMLETAQAAGLVSPMNAKLICDEYARLATFARDRYSLISARVQDLSDAPPSPSPLGFFKGQKDIPSYRTSIKTDNVLKGQSFGARRKDIIDLFTSRDKISIKDAVSAVPGVSEKTIQRELLSMVEEGLLIKEGERRWSTYRKANP